MPFKLMNNAKEWLKLNFSVFFYKDIREQRRGSKFCKSEAANNKITALTLIRVQVESE